MTFRKTHSVSLLHVLATDLQYITSNITQTSTFINQQSQSFLFRSQNCSGSARRPTSQRTQTVSIKTAYHAEMPQT